MTLSAHSKELEYNKEDCATGAALAVKHDCFLDCCLEWWTPTIMLLRQWWVGITSSSCVYLFLMVGSYISLFNNIKVLSHLS